MESLLSLDDDTLQSSSSDDEVIHVEHEKEADRDSNGGENEVNLIHHDPTIKLFVSKTVNDLQEAYNSYCECAHSLDFSVRKFKQYFLGKLPKLKRKEFCCCKRRFKNDKCKNEETFIK